MNDDEWFKILTGRTQKRVDIVDSALSFEEDQCLLLRRAIIKDFNESPMTAKVDKYYAKENIFQQLLFRLKSENLLNTNNKIKRLKTYVSDKSHYMYYLCALTIFASLLLHSLVLLPEYTPDQIEISYYGGVKDIQLRVKNVDKTKNNLFKQFSKLDSHVHSEKKNNDWCVVFEATNPSFKKSVQFLLDNHLLDKVEKVVHKSGIVIVNIGKLKDCDSFVMFSKGR